MFNGAFTIAETSNLGTIVLTDTSTGADAGLTGRTISIFRADGTAFTDPIPWPLAQSSITLDDIFNKDIAVNIRVDWGTTTNPVDPASTYTANEVYAYTDFGEYFLYNLTQLLMSKPDTIQADDFYKNMFKVRTDIDNAHNCIDFASDQKQAQQCLDRVQNMIDNQNTFF